MEFISISGQHVSSCSTERNVHIDVVERTTVFLGTSENQTGAVPNKNHHINESVRQGTEIIVPKKTFLRENIK